MIYVALLVAEGSGIAFGIIVRPYLARGLRGLVRSWRDSALLGQQRRSGEAAKAQQRAHDQVRAKRG